MRILYATDGSAPAREGAGLITSLSSTAPARTSMSSGSPPRL